MASSARLMDMWTGICCCHHDPPCVPMGGYIITSSPNVYSSGRGQGRLIETTIGFCGHSGIVITASMTSFANSLGKARIGDSVVGCNIGTVITGNPTHDIGEGGSSGAPLAVTKFQDRIIVHTEVDFGNVDDSPATDDGLNIYPPIPTVNGVPSRPPTAAEIAKSESLDSSPTTTVEDSTSATAVIPTPPTSCTEVTDPPPANFQLSTNFSLADLSTGTALSKNRVRAQNGLSVQDIVCNLQGWAEHVGEAIAAQYGRGEILITSGFRLGSGSSQHDRGQAADLQFPNMNNQGVYDIAIWINENVPFDQLILEYGGHNPWIHVSFNRAGNRPATASNKFGTRVSPGHYVWGTLRYME
jgi:hypothetical protein